MKVMTILGTRPDIIKLSEIVKKLDVYTEHILVHTGQNYDKHLSEVFFKELGLRPPNYYLGIADNTLGQTLSKLMSETENVLMAEKPDAVVILGDTNSSLAGIIAKRRKIPLFHLEAGNRCFDDNVPEEINRRIIDHISDVNLVYTENSRRYLLDEGIAKDRIFLMGSPMGEVLTKHYRSIRKSKVLKTLDLKKGRFYLVSVHREENLEIDENLISLFAGLYALAEVTQSTIVMSMHPHTRNKLKEAGIKLHKNTLIHGPFGFLDYCKLQMSATCVISDSGTIAEESSLLNFAAVTVRNSMERPEAIDAGSLILSQPDISLINAVSVAHIPPDSIPPEYTIENCSERVLRVILGFTDYVNRRVYV